MKTFKAICAASVLALSLSIPAYAEDPPPPPPGDIHIPGQPIPGDVNPTTETGGGGGATVVGGDISSSALADMFWALAAIL